jgi:hypothetical protein
MESLESLSNRIEYGRNVDNDASKMFFSLEPTLRFSLIYYLIRNKGKAISEKQLYHVSDLELISIFEEVAEPDAAIYDLIFELYQAVTDFRLITFSQRHGISNETIKAKSNNLKNTDYYLNVMENVVTELQNAI